MYAPQRTHSRHTRGRIHAGTCTCVIQDASPHQIEALTAAATNAPPPAPA